MPPRHPGPLPAVWLVSDARNDAVLEAALRRMPHGSGFIFRHYHLPPAERWARLRTLSRIARARRHRIALAGPVALARAWRADAAYGDARTLARRGGALPRLVTAHSLREIGRARGAHALLLSPVFATRSHPGGSMLGSVRFRLLAARAQVPVIALGGMTPRAARRLRWPCWAAIDGLS